MQIAEAFFFTKIKILLMKNSISNKMMMCCMMCFCEPPKYCQK